MKKAIIVFTRVPIAEKTKTRMMPALTPKECEQLHISFLKDVNEELKKVDADIFVAFTPKDEKGILLKILKEDKVYFSQVGEGLGDKMCNSLSYVLNLGYDFCILIGTDIPEINEKDLYKAFEVLEDKEVVLGPTIDGGYYLVGMKTPIPEVFENKKYGKNNVLENTTFNLKKNNITFGYTNTHFDIDTIEDLRKFRKRIKKNSDLQNTESGKLAIKIAKISVIIPIYNEENTILELQNQLIKVKDKCEIIFVDGGSTDNTLNLIKKDFKVLNSKKGRANQMNLGAEKSTGDILFFLHSDSKLPEDFLEEIRIVTKNCEMGCFGIVFDSKNFFMFTCEVISNFRAKYRRIVFGDQGLFINRELFFKVGMFPNLPIMEDYQLSLTLKKENIKVGMTKNKIETSDRRYPNSTIAKLKLMWQMYKLRKMYRKGVDIDLISIKYRDIR